MCSKLKGKEARSRIFTGENPAARPEHRGASDSKQQTYDRLRDLPGLLPIWPAELSDFSLEGTRKLLVALRKATRTERLRGSSGHWAYDLGRHLALVKAYKAESLRYREAYPAKRSKLRLSQPP